MAFADFLRAFFALALTLGLVGLAAVALRRFGPDALARFTPTRKERRLAIVETLVLDLAIVAFYLVYNFVFNVAYDRLFPVLAFIVYRFFFLL